MKELHIPLECNCKNHFAINRIKTCVIRARIAFVKINNICRIVGEGISNNNNNYYYYLALAGKVVEESIYCIYLLWENSILRISKP